MSVFTYLVTVETERDSGMHAGRDEQSELIEEAITDGAESASLDGLGPRSDSSYSVASVDIEPLVNKGRVKLDAEYERTVAAEKPKPSELEKELKEARQTISRQARRIETLEYERERHMEEQELKATRIYQASTLSRYEEGSKTYLRDGQHDSVCFKYGERWDALFEVGLDAEGRLHIGHLSGGLSVVPESGNRVRIEPRGH